MDAHEESMVLVNVPEVQALMARFDVSVQVLITHVPDAGNASVEEKVVYPPIVIVLV